MSKLVQPRKRKDFKYTSKGNRIYTPDDEDIYLLNPHVLLDSEVVWDAIEVCPKEGWVVVHEHTDDNNLNRNSAPKLVPDGKGGERFVRKILRGKVEIAEPIISK